MFEAGMRVNILPPFLEFFPGTYTVERSEVLETGTTVLLEGIEPAFDPCFLMEATSE